MIKVQQLKKLVTKRTSKRVKDIIKDNDLIIFYLSLCKIAMQGMMNSVHVETKATIVNKKERRLNIDVTITKEAPIYKMDLVIPFS